MWLLHVATVMGIQMGTSLALYSLDLPLIIDSILTNEAFFITILRLACQIFDRLSHRLYVPVPVCGISDILE